jgi:hypothetical protein
VRRFVVNGQEGFFSKTLILPEAPIHRQPGNRTLITHRESDYSGVLGGGKEARARTSGWPFLKGRSGRRASVTANRGQYNFISGLTPATAIFGVVNMPISVLVVLYARGGRGPSRSFTGSG